MKALKVLMCIAIYLAVVSIETLVVQGLWNWVIVGLFSAPKISFWVALGVLFILNFVGSIFRGSKK